MVLLTILVLVIVSLLNIWIKDSKSNISMYYSRIPKTSHGFGKKPPVQKQPPLGPAKAPTDTNCTKLPDTGLSSRGKICCSAPNCQSFKCNPGTTPVNTCLDGFEQKCATENDVTYCICTRPYPTDGKCPDGYELKNQTGGACDGRVPPQCICTMNLVTRPTCFKNI